MLLSDLTPVLPNETKQMNFIADSFATPEENAGALWNNIEYTIENTKKASWAMSN